VSLASDVQGFVGQCVGFVEKVSTWVPVSIPGYSTANASDYTKALPSIGSQQVKTPAVGDVVIWTPNQAGSSAGHIAIISAVTSTGVDVTQSNWGTNQRPSIAKIPTSVLNNLAVFAAPNAAAQATAAANASASETALQASNAPVFAFHTVASAFTLSQGSGVSGTAGSGVAGTLSTVTGLQGTPQCTSLSDYLRNDTPLASVPLIGPAVTAATAPVKVLLWAKQPCKIWSAALVVMALGAAGMGFYLLFRKQADAVIGGAQSAVAKVGALAA
jgi:hypothetical protein